MVDSKSYIDTMNGTTCKDKVAGQTYKKNLQNIPGLLEYMKTYNKKFKKRSEYTFPKS